MSGTEKCIPVGGGCAGRQRETQGAIRPTVGHPTHWCEAQGNVAERVTELSLWVCWHPLATEAVTQSRARSGHRPASTLLTPWSPRCAPAARAMPCLLRQSRGKLSPVFPAWCECSQVGCWPYGPLSLRHTNCVPAHDFTCLHLRVLFAKLQKHKSW